MKKNLIIVLLLCLIHGCTHTNKNYVDDENLKIIVSSGIKNSLNTGKIFKESKIIPLETNDNSLLRRIDRIYIHDDELYVYDKSLNKIVIFNSEGKYLRHIHRVGYGPGEYDSTMDFCLDTINKQILLLCDRPYKIMKFKYSGELIEEKRFDELLLNIIVNSGYVYCNKSNQDLSVKYELFQMDSDCKLIGKHLLIKNDKINSMTSPGKNLVATLNAYYTRRFDNSIYQIEKNGIKRKYVLDFKENSLPENFPVNDEENFFDNIRERQYIYNITEVSESKNYIFFMTNIAIFVLDKETDVLTGYKAIFNSTLGSGENSYMSVGNSPQMIAVVIEPFFLHVTVNAIKSLPKYNAESATFKLAEKVKEDDNPILILYEFK
jgi:hypothetical protein